MTTLYRGYGHPNVVTVEPPTRGIYRLGKNNSATFTAAEIDTYCEQDVYVVRMETLTGNNALSFLFTRDADGDNSVELQILSDLYVRKIPATTTLTIYHLPNIDPNGDGVDLTVRLVGDTFDVQRTFSLPGTYDPWGLDPEHPLFDLRPEDKTNISGLFTIFENTNFNTSYVLCRGALLFLARKSNYQSETIPIMIKSTNLAAFKTTAQALIAAGANVQKIVRNNNDEISNIRLKKGRILLEVKVCYEESTYYRHYGYDWELGNEVEYRIAKDYLDNTMLYTFKGIDLSVPVNYQNYLVDNYGADWQTPQSDWDHLRDNLTMFNEVSHTGVINESATVDDII